MLFHYLSTSQHLTALWAERVTLKSISQHGSLQNVPQITVFSKRTLCNELNYITIILFRRLSTCSVDDTQRECATFAHLWRAHLCSVMTQSWKCQTGDRWQCTDKTGEEYHKLVKPAVWLDYWSQILPVVRAGRYVPGVSLSSES